MSTKITPVLIKGNVHSDQRGQLFLTMILMH
ncbi:hypothetical protein FLSU104744_16005 [Flavobacterium succinicans]